MAATAICLQFRRRRRNTSILLFQNPISLHLFSSIPDPPNNSDDQTPPSQSQTSLFSHFSDLKSRFKQLPEFYKDLYRKYVMARNGSPNSTGSSTEGGKSLLAKIRESSMEIDLKCISEKCYFRFADSVFETMGQCNCHHFFAYLCEEEVIKGNRTNTTLNEVGWANVQKEFWTKTGSKCTIKQMKNHWDSMKTVWQLYKKIGRTYTGLGWDKYVSDEADAWWDERKLEYPELKNYRRKDLFVCELSYDVLFKDIVATGEKTRAPNQQSGIRRDSMCNEEFDPTPQEETGKEGSGDSDEDLATPTLSPTSCSGKSKVSSGSKRKMSGAELVREGLDGILRALSTATTAANEGGSYAKALDMLDSMDGVEPMSSLYHFGQQFLGKKENRVLWFKSRNDEYRLSALKYNYEEHLRNGGC